MATQPNPNDPYRLDPASDNLRGPARFNQDLQVDPQPKQGPVTGGRIAAFAAAILLLIGAVYYGMNMSSTEPRTASQPANQTAAQNSPAAPPVRNVTPSNTQPGMTTGAAPAQPQQPAANAPTGAEVDRSAAPAR